MQVFCSFLRKMELFGAGHPLVWYILKQLLFTSASVKSGRYFDILLAATHLSKCPPLFTSTLVNNKQSEQSGLLVNNYC